MRQNVYIIYDKQTEYVCDKICEKLEVDGKFMSENSELTTELLVSIAKNCSSRYFYIIKTDKELIFDKFDFSYVPKVIKWDRNYIHVWNNDTSVRLYDSVEVLDEPEIFNDTALKNGTIKIKNIADKIYTYPYFDIIFLSYDEEYSDANYKKLLDRFPRAKRLHGVKGILKAHKMAARLAETDMFYIVDADAEIVPTFDFSYQPQSLDRQSVHVWHSSNPVNDLEYGYGGVKLFPTLALIRYIGSPIDFTTTVSNSLVVKEEVSNITKFNTDPFSAWRSGFRECVKLASKIIPNHNNEETEHRLDTWCTKGGDREFGEFTIMGALDGAAYGKQFSNQPSKIRMINDFEWLEERFSA